MPKNIANKLDECYFEVVVNVEQDLSLGTNIPPEIKKRIDSWDFGGYGWTSPVNIMITAAWYKWHNPMQDVCKIWAKASNEVKIDGGFSIRNQDEAYTVPFLTKFRLTERFASPNSGMQGSRALEKNQLRDSHGRIDRDSDLGQGVKFSLDLFQNIMNDINDAKADDAKIIFMYFIEKSLKIQKSILVEKSRLRNSSELEIMNPKEIVLQAVNTFKDPQFVKTVAVSIANEIIKISSMFQNCSLSGVNGSKTASDARANTPGDFWIINSSKAVIVACEVKDTTKTIGFDVLSSIQKRIESYPELKYYILVSAAEYAISFTDLSDPQWKKMILEYEKEGIHILDFTVREFINLLELLSLGNNDLIGTISKYLVETMDLKKDTLTKWNDLITLS